MWVIAETKDLPINFIKIVVADDRGRFVLPELPTENYSVWERGYGIVDSSPIPSELSTSAALHAPSLAFGWLNRKLERAPRQPRQKLLRMRRKRPVQPKPGVRSAKLL